MHVLECKITQDLANYGSNANFNVQTFNFSILKECNNRRNTKCLMNVRIDNKIQTSNCIFDEISSVYQMQK